MLQIRDLTIRYLSKTGELFTAVEDLSLDIGVGESVGLMGESGCGKSTVALSVLGLLPKDKCEISGSVQLDGSNLLVLDESSLQKVRGASISLIHQEPSLALSPLIRVGEQVAEVIHAHRKWNWKACSAEARAILSRVGLRETDRIFSAYPHQLSGGQCQRVVLAQALACGPRLLIADEPTAHLDARSQAEFLAQLKDLKVQTGMSLLLISHTPEVQARLADRLLIMRAGRIIEQGHYSDLCCSASHPYTRSLLRSTSRVTPSWDNTSAAPAVQELA
ncbi:MAG TPA: ABC transporter ATP-binding protein [Candidatus Acidoferrum sp.]|nr:ABC transporter ATP-binding protein [Candidatus Acidoferrum sp.]